MKKPDSKKKAPAMKSPSPKKKVPKKKVLKSAPEPKTAWCEANTRTRSSNPDGPSTLTLYHIELSDTPIIVGETASFSS